MTLKVIATWLVILGGLVWLLVGLAGVNVVEAVLGTGSTLARIVYILVGLSALYGLADLLGMTGKK